MHRIDALRHDELQQTSVFTGNVVMTKGSIVLRGRNSMCAKTRRATMQGHRRQR